MKDRRRRLMPPTTPVSQMSVRQLRTALVFAERHLHSHRRGVHGSCHQRCEEPFPCTVARAASKTLREVSEALAARNDQIELTKSEWR